MPEISGGGLSVLVGGRTTAGTPAISIESRLDIPLFLVMNIS